VIEENIMRKISLSAATSILALSAALSLATPAARADEVASRCGQDGCDRIRCDDSGNRCVRYSDYDNYYNGYTNGYDRGRDYSDGSYGGEPTYDNRYDNRDDNGYYGGYDDHGSGYEGDFDPYDRGQLVCDSSGDRCYSGASPYWDYREYYRLHGYHWDR
jgi:hypothetical protein